MTFSPTINNELRLTTITLPPSVLRGVGARGRITTPFLLCSFLIPGRKNLLEAFLFSRPPLRSDLPDLHEMTKLVYVVLYEAKSEIYRKLTGVSRHILVGHAAFNPAAYTHTLLQRQR